CSGRSKRFTRTAPRSCWWSRTLFARWRSRIGPMSSRRGGFCSAGAGMSCCTTRRCGGPTWEAEPPDSPDLAALALVQSPVSPDYPVCQREEKARALRLGPNWEAEPPDSPDFAALAQVQSPVSPDYPMVAAGKKRPEPCGSGLLAVGAL